MSLTFTSTAPTAAGNFYYRTADGEACLMNVTADDAGVLRAAAMLPAAWNIRPVFAVSDLAGEWAPADDASPSA